MVELFPGDFEPLIPTGNNELDTLRTYYFDQLKQVAGLYTILEEELFDDPLGHVHFDEVGADDFGALIAEALRTGTVSPDHFARLVEIGEKYQEDIMDLLELSDDEREVRKLFQSALVAGTFDMRLKEAAKAVGMPGAELLPDFDDEDDEEWLKDEAFESGTYLPDLTDANAAEKEPWVTDPNAWKKR